MAEKTKKKSKYTFVLKNIDIDKICNLYNIKKINVKKKEKSETTKISNLNTNCVSFLDKSKQNIKTTISMIDFQTNKEIQNNDYCCFWCKHEFDSNPIGCPIKYLEYKANKEYNSIMSKEKHVIQQNITKDEYKELNSENIIKGGYYLTDGVFCSFNCCKSWIIDNNFKKIYEDSESLLLKLYREFNDISIFDIKITPAPSWRILKKYGGFKTIEEFRSELNCIDYTYHGTINPMVSIQHLYQEHLKF